MGMDRPGTEPGPSRMLSGCDAATPTAPELRGPKVLKHLQGTVLFRAQALSRPARSAFFLALLWLVLAVDKRAHKGAFSLPKCIL